MSSLNARAAALADRMASDAVRLGVAVREVAGARIIDCGAAARGGYGAGVAFAEVCMGGLGAVRLERVAVGERSVTGVGVATDHPLVACLGAQYAGWRLEEAGFFAMASGPGRALARAEPLFDELAIDERASVAVLALETRSDPPAALVERLAARMGVRAADVTLLIAPTASIAGGVQVAARVVETALHKLHELGFPVERVLAGEGTCPLPPVARSDGEAIGRTNDAVLYGGSVQLTVDADDDALAELVPQLPASASADFGRPFGAILEAAGWDFYAIDPLLFSPAVIAITNVASGRTFSAGHLAPEVLEASFWG